ncbi:molybdate ABC transporter substrate-binding protein [Rhodoplanes sp. Z2-YC6860]|uniref:molybdate ABC transporter substrate-binding protein n=1 Tax=Rhodoplanes sp. Z2-YC6860 TaxID=674703 RepID=UPI00078C4AD7|nr:substrate-binding domain-containing protein [Rhodoplanes sp. Z2-YC6860]AMN43064.1 molybdate ABC transporter substrate-binding protein [Rhodoplanes sp. Z2-YC6860]
MNANLKHVCVKAFLAVAFCACTAKVQAADIKVMSDSPLEPALTKVVDLYRQQSHNKVGLVFDPSPAVKKRIEDGESADVVIVQPDFAEALTKSGKVSAGDRPIIGHVGVGLGNRKDSPAYDISTVEKFKSTLLGADLLVFNSVKSGEAFAGVLERLGIAGTLKSKIVRTTPLGIFEPVLKGKGNDMAAGTIPLIATTPGIKLLGPLPAQFQSSLTYTAVLMAKTSQRDAAEGFIKFLVSREAKAAFAANGAS